MASEMAVAALVADPDKLQRGAGREDGRRGAFVHFRTDARLAEESRRQVREGRRTDDAEPPGRRPSRQLANAQSRGTAGARCRRSELRHRERQRPAPAIQLRRQRRRRGPRASRPGLDSVADSRLAEPDGLGLRDGDGTTRRLQQLFGQRERQRVGRRCRRPAVPHAPRSRAAHRESWTTSTITSPLQRG